MGDFHTDKKLIGQGKVAKVYFYEGYAYKVFKQDCSPAAVEYEINIQQEIAKTSLPVVRYYKTDNPLVIKMDFIDGAALADKMRREKYPAGLSDLLTIQKEIHNTPGVKVPGFTNWIRSEIEHSGVPSAVKETAFGYLAEIPEGEKLCHLDLHFLNIMRSSKGYYIIDWVNAKLGNPIFDFARTYVIMFEFANRISGKYLKLLKESGINPEEFRKAVFIMAVQRMNEGGGEKVKRLIDTPACI